MTVGAELDAGSFRDPDSRVFYSDAAVLRALSERGARDWRALAVSRLFGAATAEGRLVATEEVAVGDDLQLLRAERPAAVLRHERIPFVSYPYEWTPGMLRDAALLQLDLLLAALDEDLTLKDATPYNVQFRGASPVFVDVGSFEPLRDGEPWLGYRQFCELFLYPLLLAVWTGVPFQPWLRGSLDGIRPSEMRALMSLRDRFRRGALAPGVEFPLPVLGVLHADHDRLDRAALETAASAFGDAMTAGLAVRHRGQEARMLEGVHREIPRLTQAAMRAAAGARASYELAETAAAQRLRAPNDREAGRAVGRGATVAADQPSPARRRDDHGRGRRRADASGGSPHGGFRPEQSGRQAEPLIVYRRARAWPRSGVPRVSPARVGARRVGPRAARTHALTQDAMGAPPRERPMAGAARPSSPRSAAGPRRGRRISVELERTVDAPIERVWALLRDYRRPVRARPRRLHPGFVLTSENPGPRCTPAA